MIKNFIFGFVFLLAVFISGNSYAQNIAADTTGIPRFIAPAVDFVQGALIALDSLQAGEDFIDASVYDTKSYKEKISDLILNKKLDSLQLIIGSVRDEEYQQLADFALQKNIPFISVTYPNDGGIKHIAMLFIVTFFKTTEQIKFIYAGKKAGRKTWWRVT